MFYMQDKEKRCRVHVLHVGLRVESSDSSSPCRINSRGVKKVSERQLNNWFSFLRLVHN